MTGLLAIAVGLGGCAIMIVAVVLVVWAIANDRRGPST
jgi:hypothetical protein